VGRFGKKLPGHSVAISACKIYVGNLPNVSLTEHIHLSWLISRRDTYYTQYEYDYLVSLTNTYCPAAAAAACLYVVN